MMAAKGVALSWRIEGLHQEDVPRRHQCEARRRHPRVEQNDLTAKSSRTTVYCSLVLFCFLISL